jgi:hypothetical protein
MEEIKSLINVKYMEAVDNTLYSRSFIGDRLPGSLQKGKTFGQVAIQPFCQSWHFG